MSLTAKQEAFAQALADGKNQSDAYRSSYSASKMTDKQIHEEASKLAADPKVSQRWKELKAQVAEKVLWTRLDSVKALKSIADGLGSETKPNEAVAAIKELNLMHGFNAPTEIKIGGEINVIERRLVKASP